MLQFKTPVTRRTGESKTSENSNSTSRNQSPDPKLVDVVQEVQEVEEVDEIKRNTVIFILFGFCFRLIAFYFSNNFSTIEAEGSQKALGTRV